MEITAKENDIKFISECLNSDLYSYKEFIDDMIEKEGSVCAFLNKHTNSLNEWKGWFLGKS